MFNYPILLKVDTLYSKLGISPDAKPEDISDAKAEIHQSVNIKKRELEKQLTEILEKPPELSRKKEKIKELSCDKNLANSSECQKLHSDIRDLEKEAQKTDPEYKKLEKEIDKANKKINEINIMKLENEAERKKYDMATPPCALLKLADFTPELLLKNSTKLYYIRKSLADFFEKEKNINCYHPSDFTRTFFHDDFEFNPLIDKEML